MDTKNVVALVGRLAADPELKYLDSGTPVANFSIAINRSTRKPDGSFEDTLDGFFDCELFGGQAVTLAEDFGKGSTVQIQGALRQKKFKVGKGDNQRNVSKIEIRVASIAAVLKVAKADNEQPAEGVEAPAQQAELASA